MHGTFFWGDFPGFPELVGTLLPSNYFTEGLISLLEGGGGGVYQCVWKPILALAVVIFQGWRGPVHNLHYRGRRGFNCTFPRVPQYRFLWKVLETCSTTDMCPHPAPLGDPSSSRFMCGNLVVVIFQE